MATQTLYHTLGVQRSATGEQIRLAFRTLAKSLHPDINPGADAPARFAAIARAYEVLSDPLKRREYDRSLDQPPPPPPHVPADLRPHYSWRNVGGDASSPPADPLAEFDELYDLYFGARGKPSTPRQSAETDREPPDTLCP